jgi:hypothetical protein
MDEQLIQEALEKLDFEPKCEVAVQYAAVLFGWLVPLHVVNCDAPAAWMAVCRKCGASAFSCEAHHEEAKTAAFVGCGVCGTKGAVADVFVETHL